MMILHTVPTYILLSTVVQKTTLSQARPSRPPHLRTRLACTVRIPCQSSLPMTITVDIVKSYKQPDADTLHLKCIFMRPGGTHL